MTDTAQTQQQQQRGANGTQEKGSNGSGGMVEHRQPSAPPSPPLVADDAEIPTLADGLLQCYDINAKQININKLNEVWQAQQQEKQQYLDSYKEVRKTLSSGLKAPTDATEYSKTIDKVVGSNDQIKALVENNPHIAQSIVELGKENFLQGIPTALFERNLNSLIKATIGSLQKIHTEREQERKLNEQELEKLQEEAKQKVIENLGGQEQAKIKIEKMQRFLQSTDYFTDEEKNAFVAGINQPDFTVHFVNALNKIEARLALLDQKQRMGSITVPSFNEFTSTNMEKELNDLQQRYDRATGKEKHDLALKLNELQAKYRRM